MKNQLLYGSDEMNLSTSSPNNYNPTKVRLS